MIQPFTSESVTEGHPDKVCDRISDAILDAMLEVDKNARVALETIVTTGTVYVIGEVTTSAYVEIPQIVRNTLRSIGYTSSQIGFDADSCGVAVSIGAQSPDIADGVDSSLEERSADAADKYDRQGAGDQGLIFGYACNETKELMPLPIHLSHRLAEKLAFVRKSGIVGGLRPDGKTQVTVNYDENEKPVGIASIVISTQHDPEVELSYLQKVIKEQVIVPVFRAEVPQFSLADTQILINPSGRFVVGGPLGDSGLTGRKLIVDTYGGMARHGGGAFSGKDPSKVDRSAAYAARWIAKNIVAAELAERCEIQISYAIGKAHPVSLRIETFGTEKVPVENIKSAVEKVFDLRPAAIIEDLQLLRPIYAKTSAYGHFGRELPEFTWEYTDRAAALKEAVAQL